MPAAYTKKQSVALRLVAACAIGILAGTFYLINQLILADRQVAHTLQVMKESDESLLCLLDCETAYRGYLASNDRSFLEPWEHCEHHVFTHVNELARLTEDNPQQQALLHKLVQLTHEKVDFGRAAIAARERFPEARARDIIDIGVGKKIMDEFRKVTAKVREQEERLYVHRLQHVKELQDKIYAFVGLLSVLMAGLLIWIGVSTQRFAREQEQMREIILSARDSAIRANELKSQFVANVSHEIRTPLSGVLGMSELLSRLEADSDRQEMVGHIHRSAQNLLLIVNDLLDFSKLEAGKIILEKHDFVVKPIIRDLSDSVNVVASGKNVHIKTEIDPDLINIVLIGDPSRLRQILLNLAHNAVKFTEQGFVQISASVKERTGNNAVLRFSVKDSGIGISQDNQEKLFQPFVQADGSTTRRYGGTGLGLSICKRLVELMHGEIGCVSAGEGQGSEFFVVISFEVAASPAITFGDQLT